MESGGFPSRANLDTHAGTGHSVDDPAQPWFGDPGDGDGDPVFPGERPETFCPGDPNGGCDDVPDAPLPPSVEPLPSPTMVSRSPAEAA